MAVIQAGLGKDKTKRAEGMLQVVECLPSKFKATV
jgi:hypothetical protein